jgi:hypothetical protein
MDPDGHSTYSGTSTPGSRFRVDFADSATSPIAIASRGGGIPLSSQMMMPPPAYNSGGSVARGAGVFVGDGVGGGVGAAPHNRLTNGGGGDHEVHDAVVDEGGHTDAEPMIRLPDGKVA